MNSYQNIAVNDFNSTTVCFIFATSAKMLIMNAALNH